MRVKTKKTETSSVQKYYSDFKELLNENQENNRGSPKGRLKHQEKTFQKFINIMKQIPEVKSNPEKIEEITNMLMIKHNQKELISNRDYYKILNEELEKFDITTLTLKSGRTYELNNNAKNRQIQKFTNDIYNSQGFNDMKQRIDELYEKKDFEVLNDLYEQFKSSIKKSFPKDTMFIMNELNINFKNQRMNLMNEEQRPEIEQGHEYIKELEKQRNKDIINNTTPKGPELS